MVILKPRVFTILQPPKKVPSAMEVEAKAATTRGTWKEGIQFTETRRAVTTPIVFCASFVPWLRLTNAEETSWSRRKYRLTTWRGMVKKALIREVMSRKARTNPMMGAATMNASVLSSPPQISEFRPALSTATPTRPPIRACDELDGRPRYQVIRSQTVAPIKAAKMRFGSTTDELIIPLPIVVATAKPKIKKAMKLKKADIATAATGGSTLVAMTVETALEASWKPLTKSKKYAVAIIPST